MKCPAYLSNSPHSYYFRFRVPQDVRHLLRKTELHFSLKTGYLRQAKSRARLMAGLLQKLIMNLRKNTYVMNLSDKEIDDIIENFKAIALENHLPSKLALAYPDGTPGITEVFGDILTRAASLNMSLKAGGKAWVSTKLDWILEGMQYDPVTEIDKDSYQYNELCRKLLKISIDHLKKEKETLKAEYPELELEKLFSQQLEKPEISVSVAHKLDEKDGASNLTLSELIDLYAQENKRANNWAPRTIPEYESIFRNIIRLFGDLPLSQITKSDCQTFKQNLSALPKDYFRSTKKYERMTIPQVISKAGDSLLSVKTVNKYLERFSEVLKFGVNNGYLTSNYASGLRIKQRKRKAYEERDAFNNDDLAILFNPGNYLPKTSDSPWKFWLPLLGLYTGARLEELCQLHLADIEEVDGVWILSINSDVKSGKRVKTEYSENRQVPLHPYIREELGFIGFVERLKSRGNLRLFPELKKRSERYGHYPSRWFGNYKTKLGFPPAKKTFHSFRHNFQDNLKQQLVPESIIDELVGHKLQGETMGRYGKPYTADVLYEEAILKLDYKVDLSHLKNSKYVIK